MQDNDGAMTVETVMACRGSRSRMNKYSGRDLSMEFRAAVLRMKRCAIDAILRRVEKWATGHAVPESKNASETLHRELLALREATREYVGIRALDIGVGTL